ncbi:hypothetical protein L195_g053694, partial [Trifolium pratense]
MVLLLLENLPLGHQPSRMEITYHGGSKFCTT